MTISNNEKLINSVTLGSLMHDIGKFWQRADYNEESLSSRSKAMESSICKVYDSKYGYRHVLWTNEFFEQFKDYLPIDVFENVGENVIDNCANIASYHHAPSTVLHEIIQQADWYSSGVDRQKSKDAEDEYSKSERYKRIRLDSLFEKIEINKHSFKSSKTKYPLRPLDNKKDNIFPRQKDKLEPEDGEILSDDYRRLWDAFIDEFKRIPKAVPFSVYMGHLVHLLEKYTWCIPSSTIDIPDISLFDHSRSVAAIAVCLTEYHRQTNTMDSSSVRDRTKQKFILVGGDLSGIQSYLFNLVHTNVKGVSKILRARSFYLSMLPSTAGHMILRRLGLPLLCNLMDSGGRFILLVPNTSETVSILESCKQELDEWFKRQFFGELTLNINWDTTVSGDDFLGKQFISVLEQLSDNIEKEKTNKLSQILKSDDEWDPQKFIIDNHYQMYSDNGVCRCCGKLPATKDYPLDQPDFTDEQMGKLCDLCHGQFRLGGKLTGNPVLGFKEIKGNDDTEIALFSNLSVKIFHKVPLNVSDYYLIETAGMLEPVNGRETVRTRHIANYVPQFVKTDEYNVLCPMCKSREECEITKSRWVPHIKTFECLATASRQINKNGEEVGRPLLGILKADIDRLGLIFSTGLGEKATISRYATMSRMINVFFSSYLNNVLKTDERYKNIYTVYSGGDDLFLVGEWKAIIDFAHTLYIDFREFTSHNPDITLSGGVAVVRSKYPVNRAAEEAEENLTKSKNEGRDKLTLFDTTINWNYYPALMRYADFLDTQVNDNDSKISRVFLYKLLRFHGMYTEMKKGKVENARYQSLMAYDVSRNIKKEKEGKLINTEEMEELYKLFVIEKLDASLMNNLKIPLFYVLYKNRR